MALSARADDAPPPAPAPTQPAAAPATTDIGRTVVVVNDVDGQSGDAPAKHIAVNDDIVFSEDITTGDSAKAVIEFRDGSTFEMGPNAAVRIDSFVFNPEESTSHKALQVAAGVFRYVSGYVSSDQNTQISTPAGAMTIRGSVAEGIVDPAVPNFVYLGEGSATFTNSAGSSTLQPGNSIAVPSASTQPMAAGAMPAPVAAQALQAIENRLPPRASVTDRPAADEAWLKRTGAADLVPVAEQQRQQAAVSNRPMPGVTDRGRLVGELGLMTEANRLDLFNGRQTTRTPEQTAFLARAAREHPGAAATMQRFNTQSRTLHDTTMNRGTAFVMHGVGHAAPSADVMRRVTDASKRANPGAAATIERHASEGYRGNDRGQLNRPGRADEHSATQHPAGRQATPAERPAVREPNTFERQQNGAEHPAERQPNAQRPAERQPNGTPRPVRQPNEFERRQPSAQPPGRQPSQQREKPQKPPPKQPPGKKPPPKKDEQH
jgi:hypothetical protein